MKGDGPLDSHQPRVISVERGQTEAGKARQWGGSEGASQQMNAKYQNQ